MTFVVLDALGHQIIVHWCSYLRFKDRRHTVKMSDRIRKWFILFVKSHRLTST
jgi:hypothetical protein